MSLVEKVAYLKKKMANLPTEKKDRKPSRFSSLNITGVADFHVL